ncbi:MAG: CBS domain-containing protein [Chloroflexi bacterium]|uniref:Histidine kinase n=2 Tax=Candidatus Thermofonsia Clade 3 TaxID=2364209 RepID=A0A2M8QEJ3_9CHLR|nr:MAG: histidine kinase [Candidatus Thermofonsia Clade 3 bacterium]RMG61966.1 MAG: CBS domain-containing protein [Chloroflexota bacterium]
MPPRRKSDNMKHMTVRDAMHKGVVSCDSSISVRDAARIMNEKRLRSLVVVDFDCALAGIISETDIVAARLVHEGSKPWDQLTVGEIMTNRVLTVTPDMSLKEAAKIIIDHRIHRVVVAEPDDICNPIGILSLGDIMRYLERVEREEAGQAPHRS